MTVRTGAGDLRRTVAVHTGRTLIRLSRHLSRVGAHLLGHPSGRAERQTLRTVSHAATDAANVHDIRRSAL